MRVGYTTVPEMSVGGAYLGYMRYIGTTYSAPMGSHNKKLQALIKLEFIIILDGWERPASRVNLIFQELSKAKDES